MVLWAHVIAALGGACPALARGPLAAMAATAPVLEVVLPRLVNDLVDQGDIVLVLDDFHRLSGPTARESVAWFVEHLPENVQLVISTRTDPALPLGTLRARGHLQELRAGDLRFTAPEAAEFLNDRLGLDLPDEDVEVLVARTDGWPAGLYLAALSLAGADDRSALVRAFDGTSAHIVDFLAAEVLAAHPPELQAFMLRTSVLERLCAPLCDAVLGGDGSRSALDTLARTNLFLVALDERRRWYRFHHLFAQILRVELERREPEVVPELHRRAFAWHRAAGTADEAIHQRSRPMRSSRPATSSPGRGSTTPTPAGRHRSRTGSPAFRGPSSTQTRASWSSPRGSPHFAAERPRWTRPPRAPGHSAASRTGRSRTDSCRSPRASPCCARRSAGATSGRSSSPASARRRSRARSRRGGRSSRGRSGGRTTCAATSRRPNRGCGRPSLIAPASDQWIVGVAAVADLSLIAGMRGDRDEQRRLAREAAALARDRGLLDAVEDGEVHTALGVSLAADGRLAEALPELERGVFLRRLWRQPLDLVDGLLALAPAVAALGDGERAAALLEEAAGVVAACRDPGALPARLAEAERAAGVRPGRGPAAAARRRTS